MARIHEEAGNFFPVSFRFLACQIFLNDARIGPGCSAKAEHAGDNSDNAKAVSLSERFSRFAQGTAQWTGHPAMFFLAVAIVVVWTVTGPIFEYSDTWQLVINTGTTIITFLMVFLIQNTQNRDTMALQLKLSELV